MKIGQKWYKPVFCFFPEPFFGVDFFHQSLFFRQGLNDLVRQSSDSDLGEPDAPFAGV
jgi:hypothetical protein